MREWHLVAPRLKTLWQELLKSPLSWPSLSTKTLWAILLLAPLPFFYCLFSFFIKVGHLNQLEMRFEQLHRQSLLLQSDQKKEKHLLSFLKSPDLHYIDKHIEPLVFLLPEIKKLEAFCAENSDAETVQKRLHFLKEENRLRFVEEEIRSNELFREIEEKQQVTIELNEEDLKKLLCLIEGVTIWPYGPKEGRPQLIIRDFKLSKKALSSQEKVFVVALELIKRESLK